MSVFMQELSNRDLTYMVQYEPFKSYRLKGQDTLTVWFKDIVDNNRKVMIDPDTDPDGFFSGLIVKNTLDQLGHKNYKINSHIEKRHGITEQIVISAISEKYDYVIIVDSSINEMEKLKILSACGIKVIVIDHHQTSFTMADYDENVLAINCMMKEQIESVLEQSNGKANISDLSACALTAICMNNTLTELGKDFNRTYMVYGYITLYSDSCNMSNSYNISFANEATKYVHYIPKWLKSFMTKWDGFDRTFIEYKLVPRINALVRRNHFNILHTLFYSTDLNLDFIIDFIEKNYRETKELTQQLAKDIKTIEYKDFVIGFMDSGAYLTKLSYAELRNFTGVVASKIAENYGKATLTVVSVNDATYQGSVRDPFNRNLLSIFKHLMKSGGHNSAFGIEVDKFKLESIVRVLNRMSDKFGEPNIDMIVIDGDNLSVDQVIDDLDLMANYNEFSGGKSPICVIKKTVLSDVRVNKYEKYIRCVWGGQTITAFVPDLKYQDILVIKPNISADMVKLMVNDVI